jgi:hypothetical protein
LDDALTAARQRGKTVVSLLGHGGRLIAVVVPPEGTARIEPLGGLDTIEVAVRRVRADMIASARTATAHPLRSSVDRSLLRGLQLLDSVVLPDHWDTEGLVIVPPTQLGLVPWRMLPRLAGADVTVATTVTGWGRASVRIERPRVAAVAGPGLPAADEEAARVARTWPSGVWTPAADSTGRGLIDELVGRDVVHVAAHGEHQSENPLFSSLRLGDGLVFAHEFEHQPLRASLVVLSACDAGRVTPRPGDEGLGLTASLIELGVGTIVAPVSVVPDDLAGQLMGEVHDLLVNGTTVSRAVAMATADKPLAAASFQCFGGDWVALPSSL